MLIYFQHQQMERGHVVLQLLCAGFLFQEDLLKTNDVWTNHRSKIIPNTVRLQFLTLLFLKALSCHNTCHLTQCLQGSRGQTRLLSWLCDITYQFRFCFYKCEWYMQVSPAHVFVFHSWLLCIKKKKLQCETGVNYFFSLSICICCCDD